MSNNCNQFENARDKDGATKKSPTLSIRSTVISINSIESSVIDSDSEEDLDGLIVKKLGEQKHFPNGSADLVQSAVKSGVILSQIVDNGGVISQSTGHTTQIASLQVDRSNKVTIGNQHIFKGPTTVNLIVPPSHDPIKKSGNVNEGFEGVIDGDSPTNKNINVLKNNIKYNNNTVRRKWMQQRNLLPALLVAFIVILVFFSGIIVWMTNSQNQDNVGSGKVLRRVTRDEWIAQPPKRKLEQLVQPVSRVIIAHTQTEACNVQSTCVFRVRYLQSYHMDSKGWDDIAFNFLIGGDGLIYDGRGWDSEGAHTKGYNKDSIGIAFIGTFEDKVPNNKSLDVYNLLIQEGINLKKLKSDHRVYATSQMDGSKSPGQTFYNLIKTWSHWSDKI